MGTRCLIIMRVKNGDNYVVFCVLYKQFDGYLSGAGFTLLKFLSGIKMVNGIPLRVDRTTIANGAGDLFARIIAFFKDPNQAGDVYLMEPRDDELEEYNYFVDVIEEN